MSLKNPHKRGGMFEGADYWLFENAKQLRNNMTDAETALWMHPRDKINGLKFRRQHPIGVYVADFYCHKVKLIIEVDGSVHNLPEIAKEDKIRQQQLKDWGYEVVSFSNEQVLTQIETVLETITKTINKKFIIQQQNASSKDGV